MAIQNANQNNAIQRREGSAAEERKTRQGMNSKKKPGTFRKFIKSPKGYLTVVLLVLACAGMFQGDAVQAFENIILAIASAVLLDIGAAVYQKRKRIFPDGAVLTGLITALVLGSDVPWYQTIFAAAAAIAAKHLLVTGRKPIFNPAAAGLFLALLLFSSDQSWWGSLTLLPWWTIVLVIIGGYLITKKVQKFPQVLTFLAVYLGLFLFVSLIHYKDVSEIFRPPFINSTLFLAFFMLTDPPTSPGKDRDQIVFGVIAAVLSTACYVFFGGLSYLFAGLLAANGWNAWKSKRNKRLRSERTQVS